MMATMDKPELATAAELLHALVDDLDRRGFGARVLATDERLRVWVENRTVPQLSEAVYAAPAADGSWWLWWSWAEQLAPIEDVDTAAARIAYVLTPA